MTIDPVPRWRLRLGNYSIAVADLRDDVALSRVRELSELEKAGVIQHFEIA